MLVRTSRRPSRLRLLGDQQMTFEQEYPEAYAKAKAQADADLVTLERLVREGKVVRDGRPALRLSTQRRRVMRGMDTIRPKARKRRR